MKTSIFEKVRKWASSPGTLGVMGLGLGVGLLFFSSVGAFMVHANSEEFCSNACHEMKTHMVAEYKDSVHDKNRTGVRATCNDCHVPHGYIPNYIAKLGLVNDLWGHYVTNSLSTKEKFEAKRHELAVRVWTYMKSNDSRECRHCHNSGKMDPEKQSEKAQLRHLKAKKEHLTCIDCHFAIAHKEPEGPGPQELNTASN